MNIDVIIEDGELKKQVWSFYFFTDMLHPVFRLNDYAALSRPSTRHRKWSRVEQWKTYNHSLSTIPRPTVPPEVLEKAKAIVVAQVNEARLVE